VEPAASATYLLNDVRDRGNDRLHCAKPAGPSPAAKSASGWPGGRSAHRRRPPAHFPADTTAALILPATRPHGRLKLGSRRSPSSISSSSPGRRRVPPPVHRHRCDISPAIRLFELRGPLRDLEALDDTASLARSSAPSSRARRLLRRRARPNAHDRPGAPSLLRAHHRISPRANERFDGPQLPFIAFRLFRYCSCSTANAPTPRRILHRPQLLLAVARFIVTALAVLASN
jgi:hypothetical protein